MPGFGQKNDESRSLDILCMLDSSASLTGKKDEHSNIHASSVCGGAVTHVSAVAITQAGSPLMCQVDAVCPEKEGTGLHSQRENPSTVNVKCPSILDLLGDYPIDGSTEINPIQEEHVAFSIQGLGTVAAETPNQSPLTNNRMNGISVPRHGENPLEFINEVLELNGGPAQDLSFTNGHATFKKKKHFVDCSSYGCVENENYGLSNHPSCEVCFKRRGINYGGIRCNPTGSPCYKEKKLELASWKTLVEDGLDNFSVQSCGSEESCTSSAVRGKGVGNLPLGKSSNQMHSRGSSAYTCHGLGLKILPDNLEDENLDSNLWIHEPLEESFATSSVAKPRRDKFLNGFTQLSRRQGSSKSIILGDFYYQPNFTQPELAREKPDLGLETECMPWNSERVAPTHRGISW